MTRALLLSLCIIVACFFLAHAAARLRPRSAWLGAALAVGAFLFAYFTGDPRT